MFKYQNLNLYYFLENNKPSFIDLNFFDEEEKSPLIYCIKFSSRLPKLKLLDYLIYTSK